MKILIFSDLHLHNWQYGSTIVDGMNSRLRDQARVLDQIKLYCQYNQVDKIIFGGDLFHTHGKIDASVLKVAYEGFEQLKNTVLDIRVVTGNHDTSDKSMKTHSLHWLEGMGVYVIDKPLTEYSNGDPLFSYCPYLENPEQLDRFLSRDPAPQYTFLHQGVMGVPMGSGFVINEIFTPDMIRKDTKHVFTGHYHKHTRVNDKITVIGSAMQLTWADEGDKRGFLVLDTETGEYEQIETVAPKFKTFDLTDMEWQVEGTKGIEGNFIRVKNASTTDQEVRQMFIDAGARSVELIASEVKQTPLQPVGAYESNITELVKEYEKQKEVTPECHAVGKEIMG